MIDGGQLYQAIIPKGATLDKSRAVKDTFRGTFREAKNSIQGQANFKPIDGAVTASQVANVTNAVMNVGSMVVGQYYMSEINSKLDDIDGNLNKISSFQNDEYKSKIMALSAEVKKISEFQIEVLENEEIRKRKLDKLDSLEHKTAELLGQANLALDNYKQSKDFKEYEKQIKSADEWFRYQQILLDILYQIDNLIYVLNSGNVSKEQCFSLFDKYGKLSTNTLNKLSEWHNKETQEYKIDIEKNKRQKLGIEGFFAKPISLINKEYGYKKVDTKVTKMISKQSNAHVIDTNENVDLYKEDIVLIQKDGKTYYLPYKENN